MCRSMADIQSTAAEIRRGKKEEDRKKEERRKKLQGRNIMAPLLHRAAITRHRASTSMHSLTFCVRFLLPERHQRKPAVQGAAVMLRTPPVTRQSAASSARRPRPAGRSHYVVISRDGRKLVTRVRVVAVATQPVPRLQIRPILHN